MVAQLCRDFHIAASYVLRESHYRAPARAGVGLFRVIVEGMWAAQKRHFEGACGTRCHAGGVEHGRTRWTSIRRSCTSCSCTSCLPDPARTLPWYSSKKRSKRGFCRSAQMFLVRPHLPSPSTLRPPFPRGRRTLSSLVWPTLYTCRFDQQIVINCAACVSGNQHALQYQELRERYAHMPVSAVGDMLQLALARKRDAGMPGVTSILHPGAASQLGACSVQPVSVCAIAFRPKVNSSLQGRTFQNLSGSAVFRQSQRGALGCRRRVWNAGTEAAGLDAVAARRCSSCAPPHAAFAWRQHSCSFRARGVACACSRGKDGAPSDDSRALCGRVLRCFRPQRPAVDYWIRRYVCQGSVFPQNSVPCHMLVSAANDLYRRPHPMSGHHWIARCRCGDRLDYHDVTRGLQGVPPEQSSRLADMVIANGPAHLLMPRPRG